MKSTAMEIQCAWEAGLILTGESEDRNPVWLGDKRAFRRFSELVKWVEDTGVYPWVMPF